MEALMDNVKEAVGEPLRLIGQPPASVKDVYEKQPVSAPRLFLCASRCSPLTDCLCVCV